VLAIFAGTEKAEKTLSLIRRSGMASMRRSDTVWLDRPAPSLYVFMTVF
jgi:hypothetical protein